MSDYDDTNDLTDEEVRQLLRVIAHERDSLRKGFKALRIENHALKAEREKLLGCRDELREIAKECMEQAVHVAYQGRLPDMDAIVARVMEGGE